MTLDDVTKLKIRFLADHPEYAELVLPVTFVVDNKTKYHGYAFASKGRPCIALNMQKLAEEKRDVQYFVIKHELGHHYLGHFLRLKDGKRPKKDVAFDLAVNTIVDPHEEFRDRFLYPSQFGLEPGKHAEYYYNNLPEVKVPINFPDDHTMFEGDVSDEYRDAYVDILREAAKRQKDKGNAPGFLEEVIKMLDSKSVNWRYVLRAAYGNGIRVETYPTRYRPNRQKPWWKGHRKLRYATIVFAIDTSGSMDHEELGMILGEIEHARSMYRGEIYVCECDTKSHKFYKLKGRVDCKLKGRGGTDFRPVFEEIKKRKIDCGLLVFFTDLCGTFPAEKPSYPVIWVDTDHCDIEVPFGKKVYLR